MDTCRIILGLLKTITFCIRNGSKENKQKSLLFINNYSMLYDGFFLLFLRVQVAQFTMHSLHTTATRVRTFWSTVIVCERVYESPAKTRWFTAGNPASSHINDPLALTSVLTWDIHISCYKLYINHCKII